MLTPTTPVPSPETIRKPMVALVSLSVVIALFLIWLIYFKGKVAAPDWVGALPAASFLQFFKRTVPDFRLYQHPPRKSCCS